MTENVKSTKNNEIFINRLTSPCHLMRKQTCERRVGCCSKATTGRAATRMLLTDNVFVRQEMREAER